MLGCQFTNNEADGSGANEQRVSTEDADCQYLSSVQ